MRTTYAHTKSTPILFLPSLASLSYSFSRRPLGYRLFALAGKVLAAHLSEVQTSTDDFGLVYRTTRHALAESRSVDFIKAINFTGAFFRWEHPYSIIAELAAGFASLWWWLDMQGMPWLIDFNARAERHQCLVSVLDAADQARDPCYVFQLLVRGAWHPSREDEAAMPYISPAGLVYVDPIRVIRTQKAAHLALLRDPGVRWNLQRDDAPLEALVQEWIQTVG